MSLKCLKNHDLELISQEENLFTCPNCIYSISLYKNQLDWYSIYFQLNKEKIETYTVDSRTIIFIDDKRILINYFLEFDYKNPQSLIKNVEKVLNLKEFL